MRTMNLPKVKWGIFEDNYVLGMFYRCECGCRNIILDVIKLQSFSKRFLCLVHEVAHAVFDIFLPYPVQHLCDNVIDITGGSPELLHNDEREDYQVLYEW